MYMTDTATTDSHTYVHTLSLHDALPNYRDRANINDDQQQGDELRLQQNHKSRSIEERHDQPEHAVHRITREYRQRTAGDHQRSKQIKGQDVNHFKIFPFGGACARSEEHTSELQSLMRISYAVFCLKKTTKKKLE